ncbi:MAG: hypothetical protein ACRDFS_09810 [Chloroflexota bacterium]
MLINEIEHLLKRKDLRSADRANMARMLVELKRGEALSPQERDTLWSYIDRYRGPLETAVGGRA